MTALHPLSHALVAWLFGIRFHFYFLNGPALVEPTLKVDYASYVKTSSKKRALFHFAGVVNSVLVTLLVLLVSLYDVDASSETRIILAAIWLFTTASEIFPLILVRLGISKILFADLRKTDSYRTLREWRMRS